MAEMSTPFRHNGKLCYGGFIYSRDNRKGKIAYWRCERRKTCGGRAISEELFGKFRFQMSKQHSHPPEDDAPNVLRLRDNMKQKKKRRLPITELAKRKPDGFPPEKKFVSQKNFHRIMKLIRASHSSITLQNVADIEILHTQCKTISGQQFLLHDNIIRNEVDQTTDRTIIFATEANLGYLFSSDIWYVDATFPIEPTLFHQLWVINAKINDSVVPLVYALMSKNRTEDYLDILLRLQQKAQQLQIYVQDPTTVMVDLSEDAQEALASAFPHANFEMHLFHIKRWLLGKIQHIETDSTDKDMLLKRWLWCTIGLAFVPTSDIIETLDVYLKSFETNDSSVCTLMNEFIKHIDRKYMRGPIQADGTLTHGYPNMIWNCFERAWNGELTFDKLLGDWHAKFSKTVLSWNATVDSLVAVLRKEQDYTEDTINEIASGQRNIRQILGKKSRQNLEIIKNHVERYAEYKKENKIMKYLSFVGSSY